MDEAWSKEKGDVLSGIMLIEDALGHDVVKVYIPAYKLLNWLVSNPTLTERDRFAAEVAQAAIGNGIIYTPSKFACELLPKNMKELIGTAWRMYLLREVFGEGFSKEMLDEWPNEVKTVWCPSEAIVAASGGDPFDYLKEAIQPALKIRIVQLIISMLSDAMGRQYALKTAGFDCETRIRLISKLLACPGRERGVIQLITNLPSVENGYKLVIEAADSSAETHADDKWYWNSGAPLFWDTTCRILYHLMGKSYQRKSVLTFHRRGGWFTLRCELELSP